MRVIFKLPPWLLTMERASESPMPARDFSFVVKKGSKILCVMCCAMPLPQIERLKGLGAVGYLTKPLDMDYFLEVLDGNQKHENIALDEA